MAFFSTNQEGYLYAGENPFHTVAVALIDAVNHGARLEAASEHKILNGFATAFPKSVAQQPYSTNSFRLERLTYNSGHMAETVGQMAYVLKKLALEVIYKNPVRYQEVFENFNENTTKTELEAPTTILPIKAIEALAKALSLKLVFYKVEQDKEVWDKQIISDEEQTTPKLLLKFQKKENNLFVMVKNKKEYTHVGHLALRIAPSQDKALELETIAPLMAQINAENKSFEINVEQNLKTILFMQDYGETSNQQLKESRIKFLPETQDDLYTYLFSKLKRQSKKPEEHFEKLQLQERYIIASDVAVLISSNQIDGDELYDSLSSAKSKLIST